MKPPRHPKPLTPHGLRLLLYPHLDKLDGERVLSLADSTLAAHLVSWGTLHSFFQTAPDELTLMKLIALEGWGQQREHILRRLISRLVSTERKRIYNLFEL